MVVGKINLGFVIVAYNSEWCIGKLLMSLPTSQNVIVVDNNSRDKTKEIVKNFGCELIEANENLGYAAAVNKGIKHLYNKCDYFFVLNPDIEIKSFKLNSAHLEKYGIIQPLILLPKGNINVDELRMNVFGFVYPKNYNKPPAKNLREKEIMFFSGCAFILSKKTFDKVGEFDESLFLYYDDVDYAIRCFNKNEKILFDPNLVVEHKYKLSFGNKEKTKYLLKNRKKIINRYFKDSWQKTLLINKIAQDKYTFSAEEKSRFASAIKNQLLLGFTTKQIPFLIRTAINVFIIPYSFVVKRLFL